MAIVAQPFVIDGNGYAISGHGVKLFRIVSPGRIAVWDKAAKREIELDLVEVFNGCQRFSERKQRHSQ